MGAESMSQADVLAETVAKPHVEDAILDEAIRGLIVRLRTERNRLYLLHQDDKVHIRKLDAELSRQRAECQELWTSSTR